MKHYCLKRLRPPVGPTGSGHVALSPGRGKSPRQRSRQPGRAVRGPFQLSSTPPTPPFPHAPRRPLAAGIIRDVGDAGVSFPAHTGEPAPDAPSRTGNRWSMWGMCPFCAYPWDGAARAVGARMKPLTTVASAPPSLRELPQLSALEARLLLFGHTMSPGVLRALVRSLALRRPTVAGLLPITVPPCPCWRR